VRERRADDACADRRCVHRRCWIEEAHVSELTGLLRQGRAGDQLAGWPASMRVFARRERPHPGAQLSLFEATDGWRYSLWVTNLPERTRGWRGQLAYIDAAHRVHARVEDAIRTGKDCGLGRFPSFDFGINSAWLTASLTAATLLSWLRLITLDGGLSRAEPKTLRYRILHAAGKLVRGGRRRRLKIPADLALGRRHRHRVDPGHRLATSTLTSSNPSLQHGKDHPGARGIPGHPARQPGRRHTQTLKSRTVQRLSHHPAPAVRPRESSGLDQLLIKFRSASQVRPSVRTEPGSPRRLHWPLGGRVVLFMGPN
jgi:hypothetical protein